MKTKICWMTVCLLVASSGVTAQVRTIQEQEKSSIQKFIEKTAKVRQVQTSKQKAAEEDLITGLNISYLDEGTWFFGTKVDFSYESGLLTGQTVESFVDSEWIEESKVTSTYNEGLLTQEFYEELNDINGELEPYERYSYAYSNGILSEMMYEDWVDGEWIVGYKDVFVITNGEISEGTTYYWNDDEEEWEAMERYTMAEVNDTLMYTSQVQWETEEWTNYEREMYPGLTAQDLIDFVFNLNATLQLSAILIYNQFPDHIYQEWDGEKWMNYEQQSTMYYYTPEWLIDTRTIDQMHWEGEEAIPGSSMISYYNGKLNPDSTVLNINTGGTQNPEWTAYMKETYTYNAAGLHDEIAVELGSMLAYKYKFEWNSSSVGKETPAKPSQFRLNAAYPNPFNPTTNITYSMGQPGAVKIVVYDMLGRYVTTLVNSTQAAGQHHVQFDGAGLSSGLYLVRMEAPGYVMTQKMTLLK